MFKKQNEEKNKVGRPKLADSKLKKESIIVSCIVIFTAILLTRFITHSELIHFTIWLKQNRIIKI